ncbi:flavin reductase family protein [Streptomyces sp. NPDC003247]|uniref:flavin reductase family protein n=1 Tax=Streptomyces sp. NPDC003247 TaxID=3364677 RepID=UPI00369265C9
MITTLHDTLDPRALRDAYGCFPSGVAAVCGLVGGEPAGLAVSSFTPVSLAPALVAVCLRNSSESWAALRGLPRLGVSVLAEHQGRVGRQLSRGTQAERFHGVDWEAGGAGAVFVHGCAGWFECSVATLVPGGDHTVALLRVHGLARPEGRAPLVFHGGRFHGLAPSRDDGETR